MAIAHTQRAIVPSATMPGAALKMPASVPSRRVSDTEDRANARMAGIAKADVTIRFQQTTLHDDPRLRNAFFQLFVRQDHGAVEIHLVFCADVLT
jgi:hypothetical protein